MTIYVDNAMIPAKVGRFDARWCHLVSDQIDPTELHEFGARIGLRRAWFQRGTRLGEHDPAGDHYDVTEGKRWAAIRAGAVEIDYYHGLADLVRMRRAQRASAGPRDADQSSQHRAAPPAADRSTPPP